MKTPQSKSTKLDELRTKILGVDTTLRVGRNITEQFLPPNFYVDRLVILIEAYVESKVLEGYEKGALFALDNETLWQYTRLCNMTMQPKPAYLWFIRTLQDNINRHKKRLAELEATPTNKLKEGK